MDTVLTIKPMELSSCADYNGKLIIGKLASFNTFLYEPLSVDWATKLTRKKLCVEVLLIYFYFILWYFLSTCIIITKIMNYNLLIT